MKTINYKKAATKGLKAMPKAQRIKMLNGLEAIAKDETTGLDISTIKGLKNGYRLRVGQFRAIYTNELTVITVEKVSPRGDAYKRQEGKK